MCLIMYAYRSNLFLWLLGNYLCIDPVNVLKDDIVQVFECRQSFGLHNAILTFRMATEYSLAMAEYVKHK